MSGRNFYRIQQTDVSGAVVFSATVVVDRSEATSALRFYPNPAHGAFTIEVGGVSGNVGVIIQDFSGATVYHGVLPAASGRVMVTAGQQLVPGIYLVSVETADGMQTGKLLFY